MQPTEDKITSEELKTLVRLCKKVLWHDLETRKILQEKKINLIPCNFYSEIPSLEEIEHSFEYKNKGAPIYDNGLFDHKLLCEFIDLIVEFADEFDPPLEWDRSNPDGFFWKNPAFSFLDAVVYYCVLRYLKPDRVLEIGSGYSTLVANVALEKNQHGMVTCIEPYPKEFLKNLERVDRIHERAVQQFELSELVNLIEDSDVWFIDSTHTVKAGSDCLYIYLKAMPLLKKPVWVHSHDIFLPFGLPKQRMIEKHVYWTEQYLLHAFMLGNPNVKVLFGSAYTRRFLRSKGEDLMQGRYPLGGASLWYSLNDNEY